MRVLVLGAGVVGTTTAYFLARDGHEVTVVDRQGDVAQETSFANGGIIHISLVDPWNAPGIAWQIIQMLGREDSPALLRPRALPGMLRWGLAFLRNSSPARHRRHTLINLRLALYSGRMLRELRAATGVRYDHDERGLLKVFRDQASLDHAAGFAEMLAPHGVPYRALGAKDVLELEPALAEIGDRVVGGLHFPDDESGDCGRFTRALADEADRLGVTFRFGATVERLEADGERVTGVRTSAGRLEADRYVLALANDSPKLAKDLRLRLPIYPVKGYSLTVPLDGWNDAPRVPVVDETLKIGVVPLGDRLRLAGSAEFTGYDRSLNQGRARYIWDSAIRVYPALARHAAPDSARSWTGLRPMTPDGPPILGPTRYANVFLNTGHGHLGWTMACGSARVVADLVSDRAPAIDLDGLTAARFD